MEAAVVGVMVFRTADGVLFFQASSIIMLLFSMRMRMRNADGFRIEGLCKVIPQKVFDINNNRFGVFVNR